MATVKSRFRDSLIGTVRNRQLVVLLLFLAGIWGVASRSDETISVGMGALVARTRCERPRRAVKSIA